MSAAKLLLRTSAAAMVLFWLSLDLVCSGLCVELSREKLVKKIMGSYDDFWTLLNRWTVWMNQQGR